MRIILLLRHAKSSWDDRTLSDRERPLNQRGQEAAAAMARHFYRAGIRPGIVLCSPALRARQTLDTLLKWIGNPMVHYDERLYEANWRFLLERIAGLPDETDSMLLVGHNPGLGDLASRLLDEKAKGPAERRLRDKFPTGALAVLESPAASWSLLLASSCRLLSFVPPRDLEEKAPSTT